MNLEPKPFKREQFTEDELSEELMNDSLGTISFAGATGLTSDGETEDEGIGYSSDERQD
jgi:hypothetical protein